MTDLMPEPVLDLDVLADDHIDPLAGVGPDVLDAELLSIPVDQDL